MCNSFTRVHDIDSRVVFIAGKVPTLQRIFKLALNHYILDVKPSNKMFFRYCANAYMHSSNTNNIITYDVYFHALDI